MSSVITGDRVASSAPSNSSPTAVLSATAAESSARVFKALGDPVRLRMLSVIAAADDGEVCVCDVTSQFALSQPTISHHLKALREAGLVLVSKRATWSYYRLAPGALGTMASLLAGMEHAEGLDSVEL